MIRLLVDLARILLVSIPRLCLWAGIFFLSIVARWVGKIGGFVSFQSIPYLPLRLLVSPRDARMLRNGLMRAMDGTVDIVIDRHFGEGHAKELKARELRERLERGEITDRRRYNYGRFGLSFGLTIAALSLIFFRLPSGRAEAISLWIAVASLVLLMSVGIRTTLIDLLAYDGPAGGSLTENMKRFAWNGPVLSRLYPLTTLLILKTAGGFDDFYRATAYSFGIAWERSILDEVGFTKGFTEAIIPEIRHILQGKELSEDIPPAEDFDYINR